MGLAKKIGFEDRKKRINENRRNAFEMLEREESLVSSSNRSVGHWLAKQQQQ